MGTWESNGHVALKGQGRHPNTLRGNISKSARDRGIVIKSLSPAVSEIFGPNDIGVTTLTFQGHVTSSFT